MTVTLANPTTTIFEQARQAYAERLEVDARIRDQREREETQARERAKREVADQLQTALKEKLGLEVTISTGDLIGDDYSVNQIKHMRFQLYPFLTVGFSNKRHAQGELTGCVVNRSEYEHSLNNLAALGMLLAKADEAKALAEAEARQHDQEPAAPPPERPELTDRDTLIYNADCGVHVALGTEDVTLRGFVLDSRSFASRIGDGFKVEFTPPEVKQLLPVIRDGGLATFDQGRFVHVDGHIVLLYDSGEVIKLALGQHKAELVTVLERWITDWWPQYSDWCEVACGYRPFAEVTS